LIDAVSLPIYYLLTYYFNFYETTTDPVADSATAYWGSLLLVVHRVGKKQNVFVTSFIKLGRL